jgi:hypothetical protein
MPYVRLGKRCVWAVIFLSCIMDAELPPANGHALDAMRDSDHDGRSVLVGSNCVP